MMSRGQGQARAHQQDDAATGMAYHDEEDEDADRAPQQFGGPEAEGHPLLAIDGARRLLEPVGLFQQRCDLDLLPVLCGPALGPRPVRRRGCRREESYAVLLWTRVTRWFPWASTWVVKTRPEPQKDGRRNEEPLTITASGRTPSPQTGELIDHGRRKRCGASADLGSS
jgi:hypothetical protein